MLVQLVTLNKIVGYQAQLKVTILFHANLQLQMHFQTILLAKVLQTLSWLLLDAKDVCLHFLFFISLTKVLRYSPTLAKDMQIARGSNHNYLILGTIFILLREIRFSLLFKEKQQLAQLLIKCNKISPPLLVL